VFSVSNEVETDSRRPGYDPGALGDLGVDPREIFSREHRDEYWAQTLESTIGRQILADAVAMVSTDARGPSRVSVPQFAG
jgi:hypothetical protein